MDDEREHKVDDQADDRKDRQSSFLRGLAIGIGVVFAVVTVFSFGVFVGEQKARFSYRWGANYHRFFGGPPIGFGRPRGFFGGHGAAGTVIRTESDKLFVRSPDNAEKVILISKDTYIVKGRQKVKAKDVKDGDRVVVMGSPDSKGRIRARLIRVFDPDLRKESMWRRDDLRPLPPSFL